MSVLETIKTLYNELKPVQRKIADFFLEIDFDSLNASIEEYARRIGASVASVSRFCNKMGFDSFQKFKINLSREIQYEPEIILPIFKTSDDPALTLRKVFSEAITNLQATQGAISVESLKAVMERIGKSEFLYFMGLGGSGGVGYLGELLFSHLGCKSKALSDPYTMLVCAGHVKKNHTVIGISHSGNTREVVEAVKIGRSKGAFTVGITNYNNSPLMQVAEVCLLTACHEPRVHFAQSNSMVAQLTLIHTLYILAASRSSRSIISEVNRIEKTVDANLRLKK